MKILFATFASPEDFLERLEVSKDSSVATLRVDTKARYDADEQVILEIGYPGLPNRILTRAVAVDGSGDGQSFRLNPGEDHKRDFLIAVAAGRATASWKRRHRRFPLRIPARFVVEGEEVPLRGDAETEDMGSGGVSLRTSRTLPDGAKVTIVLEPGDGGEEIEFEGRVVWNRNDDSVAGVGVQFESLGGEAMKRLRRMIRDVKLSGKTAEGDDD
ncbi:MAG TPA: PilZ domain-containing protein [Kofleriaceae bacterium]|nr:PilZ domain-containing protein [Kofleriaceae bacterium]